MLLLQLSAPQLTLGVGIEYTQCHVSSNLTQLSIEINLPIPQDMTAKSDNHSVFWWGINVVTKENSRPGVFELVGKGTNATWTRDRHTTVRLMPLQYTFERISLARRDLSTYLKFRNKQETYITDDMTNLKETDR